MVVAVLWNSDGPAHVVRNYNSAGKGTAMSATLCNGRKGSCSKSACHGPKSAIQYNSRGRGTVTHQESRVCQSHEGHARILHCGNVRFRHGVGPVRPVGAIRHGGIKGDEHRHEEDQRRGEKEQQKVPQQTDVSLCACRTAAGRAREKGKVQGSSRSKDQGRLNSDKV